MENVILSFNMCTQWQWEIVAYCAVRGIYWPSTDSLAEFNTPEVTLVHLWISPINKTQVLLQELYRS